MEEYKDEVNEAEEAVTEISDEVIEEADAVEKENETDNQPVTVISREETIIDAFAELKEEPVENWFDTFDIQYPQFSLDGWLLWFLDNCGKLEEVVEAAEWNYRERRDLLTELIAIGEDDYYLNADGVERICNEIWEGLCGEDAPADDSPKAMADAYYFGNGVPCDKEKAAELYEQAANEGDMDAAYSLGYMYDKGDGLDKDRAQALVWYEKAADMGQESAINRLAVLKQLAEKSAASSADAPKKKGLFR